MNRKGFMMAEVIVVSAIVLMTLASFYVSYNKIISVYNKRIDYYDVTTLYDLAYVRKSIDDFSKYNSMDIVVNENYKKVYYIDVTHLKSLDVTNQTFEDYLDYLDGSVEFNSKNILVMERCIDDLNNCKYAYLEAYNFNDKTPPVINFDILNIDSQYYAVIQCSDEESGIVGDEMIEKLLEGKSNVIVNHTCVNRVGLETSSSYNYKSKCKKYGTEVCDTCSIPGQMVCDAYYQHNPNSVGCGGIVGCSACHKTETTYYSCNCSKLCNEYMFEK